MSYSDFAEQNWYWFLPLVGVSFILLWNIIYNLFADPTDDMIDRTFACTMLALIFTPFTMIIAYGPVLDKRQKVANEVVRKQSEESVSIVIEVGACTTVKIQNKSIKNSQIIMTGGFSYGTGRYSPGSSPGTSWSLGSSSSSDGRRPAEICAYQTAKLKNIKTGTEFFAPVRGAMKDAIVYRPVHTRPGGQVSLLNYYVIK